MNKKISDKDKQDWENFIKSSDKVENKDKYVELEQIEELKEKTLDLHGFNLRDANIAVGNLIVSSYNKGLKKVNIITGKGMRSKSYNDPHKSEKLSILKYSIPDYIRKQEDLMNKIKKINNSEIEDLNSGNFSIYLKTKK